MKKSVKSVLLKLELSRGTRIFVDVDPKFPYTVLYDQSAPPRKRVVAVIDKGEPVITMPSAADVRSLWLIGNLNEKAWEATRKELDAGNPGPPGTAGNGNGRVS